MSVIAKLAKDWIVSDIGSSEPLTVNQAYDHSIQHAQRGHSSFLHYGKVKVLSAIDLFHGVTVSRSTMSHFVFDTILICPSCLFGASKIDTPLLATNTGYSHGIGALVAVFLLFVLTRRICSAMKPNVRIELSFKTPQQLSERVCFLASQGVSAYNVVNKNDQGTGINTDAIYTSTVIRKLAEVSGMNVTTAPKFGRSDIGYGEGKLPPLP